MNRVKQQNISSNYKGVYFQKKANKWHASVMVNRKKKHLGFFTNEKEAAAKYNEQALEHFEKHACLNEISSDEDEYLYEEEDGTDDVQIYA